MPTFTSGYHGLLPTSMARTQKVREVICPACRGCRFWVEDWDEFNDIPPPVIECRACDYTVTGKKEIAKWATRNHPRKIPGSAQT